MTFSSTMNAGNDFLFPADDAAFETVAPFSAAADQEVPAEEKSKSGFEAFAETIRGDVPADSLLENVLVERVILAAWRLQVASELEAERILLKNKITPVTPEILRAECSLETAFSLLETARRVTRPQWSRASEPTTGPIDSHDDDFEGYETFEDLDLSNEWPILNADSNPRDAFREIHHETFEDHHIDEPNTPEPTRWQDRLVFDFNISETSPVVKGTWITVSQVVSMIVDGARWSDVLRDHPELTEDDIRTCLAYTVEQDGFGEV